MTKTEGAIITGGTAIEIMDFLFQAKELKKLGVETYYFDEGMLDRM